MYSQDMRCEIQSTVTFDCNRVTHQTKIGGPSSYQLKAQTAVLSIMSVLCVGVGVSMVVGVDVSMGVVDCGHGGVVKTFGVGVKHHNLCTFLSIVHWG